MAVKRKNKARKDGQYLLPGLLDQLPAREDTNTNGNRILKKKKDKDLSSRIAMISTSKFVGNLETSRP